MGSRLTLPPGLDGLFRGLGRVLQLAYRIAEAIPEGAWGAVEVTQRERTVVPTAAHAASWS